MAKEDTVVFTTDKPPREYLCEYFGCLPERESDADPVGFIEIAVKEKENDV